MIHYAPNCTGNGNGRLLPLQTAPFLIRHTQLIFEDVVTGGNNKFFMIHPHTELKFVSPEIGYGVFATAFIPKGTITYVQDALEIVFHPGDPLCQDPRYQPIIDRYTFTLGDGRRVLSWDHARYMNHCCNSNTITTGYGFEIAIRDIVAGEEITDEYGLFCFDWHMDLICKHANCRQRLTPSDFDTYHPHWDQVVKEAMNSLLQVEQPLIPYLDTETHLDLMSYMTTGQGYRPVESIKYGRAALLPAD